MPQIKEMARKEGVARENEKKDVDGKQMKADKVLQFLKDDQIKGGSERLRNNHQEEIR